MDHVKFLMNSDSWPRWPLCPVKRKNPGGFPTCGAVMAGTTTVVVMNVFDEITDETFDSATRHHYDSLEALVADGWEVD